MNMKVLDARFVKEFVDMADDGYSNGYHERNGGNLSYRIKPEEMYEGEIGRIAGVRFVESSEAAIYTGTENDCPSGLAVFGCLFLAEGAYGVTEVTGGGLQTIIKQLGSAGTSDPLNQRSTVGYTLAAAA
jgi:N4-gp56 family major capsid protein